MNICMYTLHTYTHIWHKNRKDGVWDTEGNKWSGGRNQKRVIGSEFSQNRKYTLKSHGIY